MPGYLLHVWFIAWFNPYFPEKSPGFPRAHKPKGEYNQEEEIAADFAGDQSVIKV